MSETELDVEALKGKRRRIRKIVVRLTVFLVSVSILVSGAVMSYRYVVDNIYNQSKKPKIVIEEGEGIAVEIPMGSGTSAIAEILKKNGLIKSALLFRFLSNINGFDGRYKAGTHIVKKGLNYNELMTILTDNPLNEPYTTVTIPEHLTYRQTVELLRQKELIDPEKFDEAANNGDFDYRFLKDIPKRKYRLEGYLFPETYQFTIGSSEKAVIGRMLEQFDKIFEERFYARAKELNMTVDQVVTLASIVEREAKVPEEKKRIAGVFHNRLKNNMKLESCATVEYVIFNRTGEMKETLSDEETKIEDPYNTYLITGLPPGPICSPGLESIEAALYPEEHGYYYFVAKNDGSGTHHFSKTYSEHMRAVSLYSK